MFLLRKGPYTFQNIVDVKEGMHQESVLSPFLFAVVVDVVTEFARECALCGLLYADDLVLMSETTEGLRDKFIKWKEAFENKGLKDNLEKQRQWSKASSQRMACVKVKLTNVGSAA